MSLSIISPYHIEIGETELTPSIFMQASKEQFSLMNHKTGVRQE
jgi:hypothetical protein